MLNTTHHHTAPSQPVRAARPALKLRLRSFMLDRAGISNFVVSGSNHCGPVASLINITGGRKAIPVRWRMIVTCEPRLDDRGFLFDQAMVGVYMDRIAERGSTLSCELLARQVAEMLLEKIGRDVPTCDVKALSLEFSPAPYAASLTVRYE
jgi:hypothetical protein